MSRNSLFGVVSDVYDSIIQHGLAFLLERSDEYYVLFKETGTDNYGEALFTESNIEEMLNGETGLSTENIRDFLNNISMTRETFLQSDFTSKVKSMYDHFGSEELFGKNINPLTEVEMMDVVDEAMN